MITSTQSNWKLPQAFLYLWKQMLNQTSLVQSPFPRLLSEFEESCFKELPIAEKSLKLFLQHNLAYFFYFGPKGKSFIFYEDMKQILYPLEHDAYHNLASLAWMNFITKIFPILKGHRSYGSKVCHGADCRLKSFQ